MVLPQGGLVQFDFSKCPAGRPCPIDKPASSGRRIDRPRPACQSDKAARQDTLKIKLYKAALREDHIFLFPAKSPSLSSIWIVYDDGDLTVYLGSHGSRSSCESRRSRKLHGSREALEKANCTMVTRVMQIMRVARVTWLTLVMRVTWLIVLVQCTSKIRKS